MLPNANILTTVNSYLGNCWVDQVLRDNKFFGEVLASAETFKAGIMNMPMKYQKGVASVSFNGFDQLPTSQQPVSVNMTFFPTFVATNVALSGTDLSVNKTQMQTIDLMKVTMASRAQDAADDVGNYFQGNGIGKDPSGLGNIVDDGTVASTYGGLSRATYTGLNATVTASGGTISLLKVRQLANSISDGNIEPDFAITDYTTWAYFEQLLMPFQRNVYDTFNGAGNASSGYKGLMWDGLTIKRDRKITTGTFYLLNMDFLKFFGLKYYDGESVSLSSKLIKGNIYEEYNQAGANKVFTWTGFIKPYNQAAVNGFMIMGGNLISTNPWRNGKLTGVTGI
jgi:hypothetical protein